MIFWIGYMILSVCLEESQLIIEICLSDVEGKNRSMSFSHLRIAGIFALPSADAITFMNIFEFSIQTSSNGAIHTHLLKND